MGFGHIDELRFIDPRAPDRLLDPRRFDKAALRAFTIIARPKDMAPPRRAGRRARATVTAAAATMLRMKRAASKRVCSLPIAMA